MLLPLPLPLLSCSSNKAIEAAPSARRRSRLLLASYEGKPPGQPVIHLSTQPTTPFLRRQCVCVQEISFYARDKSHLIMWGAHVCVCGNKSLCRHSVACLLGWLVGCLLGVCVATLRRAIIHTHAPTLYLWLYHPTTANSGPPTGIYILRPAYVCQLRGCG